jgi:hypothetical protein
MEAFYEGLFSALSNNTQAEQFIPTDDDDLLDYYLTIIENHAYIENDTNRIINRSSNYEHITAYLSAEIADNKIKFYYSEFFNNFGSNLKEFINDIGQWFKDAAHVVVEYAGKTYEIAKNLLIKILQTLQDLFTIAKTKFEEALRNGKAVLEKVGEMLKASFDTIRQAFFAAVAYASNAIKTLFTGSKLKQENITIENLKTYSELPTSYFTGKIFVEFILDLIANNVNELYHDTADKIKSIFHATSEDVKKFIKLVEDNADKLGEKTTKLFKSLISAIEMLNEDISVEKVNEIGEKMIQLNKNYTPELNNLYVKINENYTNVIFYNAFELSKKIDTQINTAFMLITNNHNYEALSKYLAELVGTKTVLENYINSIETTIGKHDPAKAQELIAKVNHVLKYIDSGINDAKTGIEIAYQIEQQNLLAEKIFRNGVYVVASVGLLFYAYKIAKGYHPVHELLTSIGLTISLMLVLFAVKFVVEYALQIKLVLTGAKPVVSSFAPDDIITAIFVISIGLVAGAMAYRVAKIDSKEARQVGIKTGKILSKV